MSIGIIILAAGSSSRMGKAKQLLVYKGKYLLEHAIDAAVRANLGPITVVLGANAASILREKVIGNHEFTINLHWEDGMASSIKNGLVSILKLSPNLNSVLLMLCDQPYVSEVILKKLAAEMNHSDKRIIASTYQGVVGVPVLFHKKFFPLLLTLKGKEGAKKLILAHPEEVATVLFPAGSTDIDTPEDYEKLLSQVKQ